MSNFTEMDCYLFGQATHYDIYRKMARFKIRHTVFFSRGSFYFCISAF